MSGTSKQPVAVASLVLGLCLLFVAGPVLLEKYVAESPRMPQPGSGHVRRFNQHGIVVYLTVNQEAAVGAIEVAGLVFIGLFGGLMRSSRSS